MNYGRAIEICTYLDLEELSESEILEAVGTILDMPTINAVPKAALLNVVRYFWAHCVDQVENGEAEEYISRESVLEHYRVTDPAGTFAYCNSILDFVSNLPAADVRPVVRGKWIEFDEDSWECSNCGQLWTLNDGTPKENSMNFCPSCGADMREVS